MDVIVSSATPATSAGTPLIEMRHLLDPCDTAFAVLAVEHPECCSSLADYPDFAAQFAGTSAKDQLLASLSGGDLPAAAVREGRCLRAPIGCGRPLIEDGSARVFWDEAEAARYRAEYRITGLCPNCQDRVLEGEENGRG
ncbi:hypothetical protein [Streptomyces decoyicus]|uniref:hypothetical protein n=1 Tax=Streptomyces decoyicus TaxID=249567 RepID=UPI0033B43B81